MTQDLEIKIIPLSSVPQYAPILAFWSYRQWYLPRDIPFDTVLQSYRVRAQNNVVPLSLVATVRSMPAGMVSLKHDDLWSRKDLNPWLASLYVIPEFRSRGIAGLLMNGVIAKAATLGIDRLYLFLGSDELENLGKFYRRRGWEFMERAVDNDGHDTEIYCYHL